MKLLDALPAEHELGLHLTTLGDLHLDLPRESPNVHSPPQDGLDDADGDFRVDVGPVPLEIIVPVNDHLHEEVAPLGARVALGALPLQAQVHPVVNARGRVHSNIALLHLGPPRLGIADLVPQVQILRRSEHCLLEGEADVHLKVGPPARPAGTAPAATEEGVEEFLRVDFGPPRPAVRRKVEGSVAEIESLEPSPAASSPKGSPAGLEIGIDARVTELVVHFTLLIVREDLVRLSRLLEFFGRSVVSLHSRGKIPV
mmetsp:Transcript_43130/g.131388  ORF Transcript_43130/g.131388 Transcript_43130/m.131388 type:complete len:257 (+) Transcript_43130:519-1289(+)